VRARAAATGPILAAALALAGPGLALATATPALHRSGLAAPDPAVVSGRLANGMRYLVMRNANPARGLSLRFYVRAGSGLETEAERGGAHLLEHMAFEGTRRFPGDSLDRAFQDAGVSLGRDQNAFTDVNGVDYVLDLAEAGDQKLDLAFTWLRDVGDGLGLDPQAVERQKGVVTAEYSARRSGSSELADIIARFMGPGLRGVNRQPAGSPESIAALSPDALRAFHDRWYRPERTTLVVVGDVDPAAVIGKIEAQFGSWTGVGEPTPDPDTGAIDPNRPESVLAVSIPNFAQGLVEVCSAASREAPLPFGTEAWRRDGADAIWTAALQDRLGHIALSPDAPFLSARVARPEAYRAAAYTCVSAVPKPERWREALAVIEAETRRLSDYGVTAVEAARARRTLETVLDSAVLQTRSRRSEQVAAGLLAAALDDRDPVSPAEQRRTFTLAEPHLTAEAATAAFRKRWSASRPLVMLASTVTATQGDLAAAWREAKAAPPPAPPKDEPEPAWAYANFGPPGQVVERHVLHDPDFVRLRFANGVRMNFKQARFTGDRVDVRVRFGAGQQEIAPADMAAALLGARSFAEGGLGRHDAETISRILRGRLLSADLAVERTHFTLAGVTRTEDFDVQAQLLAAYLTDPGFRPDVDPQVPAFAKLFYKSRAVEPVLAARAAIDDRTLAPHVFDPPPEPEFARLRAADFARALAGPLTRDAVEVTVVGDIDEQAAVDGIARTFGALPVRDETDHARPDAPRTVYPAAPAAPIRVMHEGLETKALVYVLWPLFPWEAPRQLEVRQLTLLREVLGDEVRREVRERLGQTYTPSVSLEIPYGGDQCALSVVVETSPQTADAVAEAVRAIARRLASPNGVSPEVLERVRKPLLDDTARRKETNAWWVTTLDGSWSEPYKLAQARTWRYDYATISVDEVQQSASQWLSQAPIVAIALPQDAGRQVASQGR
jgi:zinc protease